MKKHKVYKITNLITNKMYIGYTHKDILKRFREHCTTNKYYINHTIRFYGEENFKIELLESYDDKNFALLREKELIEELNTRSPNGYNIQPGGQPGYKHNPETVRERMLRMHRMYPEKYKKITENLVKVNIEKRIPVVLVSFKTKEVLKFKGLLESTEAGYTVTGLSTKHYIVLKDVDLNLTNEDYIKIAEEKIQNKLENFSRGVYADKNVDKIKKRQSMLKCQEHKKLPLVAVNVITGILDRFKGVHDARREGFAISSIYSCLNREAKTGQGFVWFYDEGQSDEYFVSETLKLIGQFKDKFNKPLKGIHLETKKEIVFDNIKEASEHTGIKVKVISRHLKGDKGYEKYVKGWVFTFC